MFSWEVFFFFFFLEACRREMDFPCGYDDDCLYIVIQWFQAECMYLASNLLFYSTFAGYHEMEFF